VRKVYALPTRGLAGRFEVVSDDIVLDQRPPVVQSATQEGGVLRLRARDERSGVRGMQVARRPAAPGRVRPFRRALRVGHAARRLYVRVHDGAGNASRWRVARRR
jgi:hypothetical protein